jgi:hypothetical protein
MLRVFVYLNGSTLLNYDTLIAPMVGDEYTCSNLGLDDSTQYVVTGRMLFTQENMSNVISILRRTKEIQFLILKESKSIT